MQLNTNKKKNTWRSKPRLNLRSRVTECLYQFVTISFWESNLITVYMNDIVKIFSLLSLLNSFYFLRIHFHDLKDKPTS